MKAVGLLLVILSFFVVDGAVYAQSPATPDLSGTWKLNLDKSKLPKGSKVQSETLVITCSPISIQMRSTVDGHESIHAHIPDGKERTLREVPGGEVVDKAKWKGPVLIIETRARLKDGFELFHSKERWSLSADGRTLTAEEDNTKKVYDKLPI